MWREKYILSCTATKTNTLTAISVEGYTIMVTEKKTCRNTVQKHRNLNKRNTQRGINSGAPER